MHTNKHKSKHFDKIPKYSPQHYINKYDDMMNKAKDAKFKGDYTLAEQILIDVYASDCHLKYKACFELAKVYKELGDFEHARIALNFLCKGSPLIHEAYYELAMINILDHKYDEAEEDLSKIKNGFNQFLYNEGMGKLRYYQGKYEEAKTFFSKARELKGYISRGNSIREILIDTRLGNYEEALDGIEKTKSYWYEHTSILLKGNIHIQQGKYTEAYKTYEKLLKTPYKNAALYRIGYLCLIQRQYEEGIKVLSKVYNDIKEHANFKGIEFIGYENLIYSLIMANVKSKNYEKAIQIIEEEDLVRDNIYNYYYKVYAFCCRMMGIEPKYYVSANILSYSGFQSKCYKKDAAYTHIIRRHVEQNEKSGTILSNTNIDEVWDFALNNMSQENRTDYMAFADVYCLDYPNIGINGEDKLIVVTNPGTNEIITLYPEFKDNVYLHTGDGDEEARSVYTSDDFKGTDDIIRVLEKDE